MRLWLRRSGLVSPADADRADYLVIEQEKVIGRIYEQRYVPADVRWLWSITAFQIDPALGIATNGRVPTLDEAKARFQSGRTAVVEARQRAATWNYRGWQLLGWASLCSPLPFSFLR